MVNGNLQRQLRASRSERITRETFTATVSGSTRDEALGKIHEAAKTYFGHDHIWLRSVSAHAIVECDFRHGASITGCEITATYEPDPDRSQP